MTITTPLVPDAPDAPPMLTDPLTQVKMFLPTWAPELTQWDDAYITNILAINGNFVYRTVWLFWQQRVADLSALTDVADAGASRPLSQTYQHAVDMLGYWEKVAGFTRSQIVNIRRRYPKRHGVYPPYGLMPYGGVYARTD